MIRKFRIDCSVLPLLAMLLVPSAAQPAAISVNGVCELGSCNDVDQLTSGSLSGDFNFDVTVNSDQYQISGAYSADFNTAGISVTPIVTYIGADPTAQTDKISINFLQDFYSTECCTWAGEYSATIPLTLSAAGSTVMATPYYDYDPIGTVGLFTGPGSWSPSVSRDLEDSDFIGSPPVFEADLLTADYNFQFSFAAGTTKGQGGGSPAPATTPEPGTAFQFLVGFIAVAAARSGKTRRTH